MYPSKIGYLFYYKIRFFRDAIFLKMRAFLRVHKDAVPYGKLNKSS